MMTQAPLKPSPQDPVLDTGQEEVFSRAEVELGRIEHGADAGRQDRPSPTDNPVPSAG
jgi:hypothetical protein